MWRVGGGGVSKDHHGDYLVAEYIQDDLTVTTLTDTATGCCGYLVREYPPGDAKGRIRSFVNEADAAAQRFFELTGVSFEVAEIEAASAAAKWGGA